MKTDEWRILFPLFVTFLRIGPVTFGGGYAMIPVIEREVVERRKWLETREVADIFAVSESVPGAIAINSATFIGYRIAGVKGALAAMLGILMPTFVIIALLSLFFLTVKDHPKVEAAFMSIRATIVALIVYAAYKIGRTAVVDKMSLLLVLVTVVIMLAGHAFIHPVLLIISGAVLGIVLVMLRNRLGWKTKLGHEPKRQEQVYDYMI